MARYSNVQTDFSGGLVSDYILGRADLKKLGNSARKFENFLPTLQGPAEYRKGFKRLSVETSEVDDSVSQIVTLSTGVDYRVVFTSLQVRIYKVLDNVLKSTLTTNYSTGDLPDMRFSAETDGIYITHPNFKPAKLTSGLTLEYRPLASTDSTALYSDEDSSGAGTVTAGDRPLQTAIEIIGDTNWTLEDISFTVEPFLPPEDTDTQFVLSQGERYLKIEAAGQFSGVVAGDYVEYQQKGEWFLAEVVDSTEITTYTILDPTTNVIYVKPVESVLDINDPDARLYLLDNKETVAGSVDENALKIDGVPDGEIHLRSDVLVFRKGFEGSWVRVGDDRRAQEVVVGHQRQNTRWVKLKEHLGSEDHPVEFIRSTTPFDEDNLTQGSTYKVYTDGSGSSATYYVIGPAVDGELKVATGVLQIPDGNRTFTFTNAVATAVPTGGHTYTVPTFTSSQTVGNLSTQVQFDVMKCDDTADDVEEGVNLTTVTGEPIITFIANDATLTATSTSFTNQEVTLGRHFMGELTTGNVYMKCIEYSSGTQIKVELINSVPRSSRTLEYENGGQLLSLRYGAWHTGNYPKTVAKYEQRRVYAGTLEDPNYVFFSQVDNDTDFRPTQDDKTVLDTDAFVYELSNRTAAVNWLEPLKDLVIGTSGGLYRVVPNQYQYGVSPKTARIELSEEEPCLAQGVVIGNSIFYPDSAGTRVLEYKYELNIQSSSSNDITKFLYPTFNTDTIKRIVYQHTPTPKLWCLTVTGNLYCLTYHRQEEFYAWSKQNVPGVVNDIVVQPRTSAVACDTVVITTKTNVSTFEVLNELATVGEQVPMLDSYVAYKRDSAGTLTVDFTSTNAYDVGDLVDVCSNGKYLGNYAVASATTLTGLDVPALISNSSTQNIVIGKKYDGLLQAMFPTWDGSNKPSYGSDTMRVVSVKPFLIDSVHYAVGVDLFDERLVASEEYTSTTKFTGFDKEIPIKGSVFGVDKVPTFKQTKPYPLTIASILTKTDLN
jgi:hypothetical protein